MRNTNFLRSSLCAALMAISSSVAVADEVVGDEVPSFDPTLFDNVTAVIGGAPTALGNFPAAVALLRVSPTSTLFNRQFCGGSAISEEYILTAAHCMFDNFGVLDPEDVLIAGDFVDLFNDSPAEIPVSQIIVHPDYDNDAIFAENDLALLRTAVPHGLPLMQLFNGDSRKLTGAPSQVVGWGLTSTSPAIFPNLLNAATVPITDFDTCSGVYGGGLGPEHLCAGFQEGGVDACQGDSGGPLMIASDNQNLQVGITSFGNGCALPDAYGVYSNVTLYESWINSIVPAPTSGELLFDSPEAFRFSSTGIGSGDDDGASDSGSSSSGFGSTDSGLLMLLLGGAWVRLTRRAKARSSQRKSISHSQLGAKALGVAAVSLALSGCAYESPALVSDELESASSSVNTNSTTVKGVSAVKNEGVVYELSVKASDEHKGLPIFDGVALTEKRETAVPNATAHYGVEPVCRGKKVAPKNSRRADFYERCDFEGVSTRFEGGSITSVTYHFMSTRIVQIDATLAGAAVAMAPLANSLDAMLGESEFTSAEVSSDASDNSHSLPQAIYHWKKSPDKAFARLQTAAQADDESFLFSLQFAPFADSIVELSSL